MYNEKMGAPQIIEGKTLDDCKDKLYKRYRSDYEIVDYNKKLKGGFLGFGQREVVEARFIVDSPALMPQKPEPTSYAPQRPGMRLPQDMGYNYPGTLPPQMQRPSSPVSVQASVPLSNSADAFLNSRDEILKNQVPGASVTNIMQVAQIAKQLSQINDKLENLEHASTNNEEHKTIRTIGEMLVENEFTPSYVKSIKEKIRNAFSLEDLDNFDLVQSQVVDWIGESVHIAPKFSGSKRFAHVMIIVGPTGVGKTTTLAKMAAKIEYVTKMHNRANPDKKVPSPRIKLITTDSMRVAAKEQLEHYAEILETSVDKAETAEDLKILYEQYKTKVDYLLIDTSGYSPRDFDNIAKMHNLLDVDGMKADIYLAITASTKARDLENIISNYDSFNFRAVIITKCDETTEYGNVISVLSERNKDIAMIGDGQQTLHCLKRAHPYQFLKYLSGFQVDEAHIMEQFGPQEDEELN